MSAPSSPSALLRRAAALRDSAARSLPDALPPLAIAEEALEVSAVSVQMLASPTQSLLLRERVVAALAPHQKAVAAKFLAAAHQQQVYVRSTIADAVAPLVGLLPLSSDDLAAVLADADAAADSRDNLIAAAVEKAIADSVQAIADSVVLRFSDSVAAVEAAIDDRINSKLDEVEALLAQSIGVEETKLKNTSTPVPVPAPVPVPVAQPRAAPVSLSGEEPPPPAKRTSIVNDLNRILAAPPTAPRQSITESHESLSAAIVEETENHIVEVAVEEEVVTVETAGPTPPPVVPSPVSTGAASTTTTTTTTSTATATAAAPPPVPAGKPKSGGGLMGMLSHMTKSRPKAGRSMSNKGGNSTNSVASVASVVVADEEHNEPTPADHTSEEVPDAVSAINVEKPALEDDAAISSSEPLTPSDQVPPRPPIPVPVPVPVPRRPVPAPHPSGESPRTSLTVMPSDPNAPAPPPRPRPSPRPDSAVVDSPASPNGSRPGSEAPAGQTADRPLSLSTHSVADSDGAAQPDDRTPTAGAPVIPPKPAARKIPGIFANQRGHNAMAALASAMNNRLSNRGDDAEVEIAAAAVTAVVASEEGGAEEVAVSTTSVHTQPVEIPDDVKPVLLAQPLSIKRKENSHSGDDKAIEKEAIDWLNTHLASKEIVIEDLFTSLGDGLNLIYALEDATGESVGRYNKRAMLTVHKNDNIAVALNFCAKKGINTAFLNPQDIMDGKKDKILTLFNYITKKF
ncbi:hypothetical protein HDU83_005477 [Entophlyctis luteolus]|nr:hypothetical protein HDU83_005477 [Entophlyctis luteolus]